MSAAKNKSYLLRAKSLLIVAFGLGLRTVYKENSKNQRYDYSAFGALARNLIFTSPPCTRLLVALYFISTGRRGRVPRCEIDPLGLDSRVKSSLLSPTRTGCG